MAFVSHRTPDRRTACDQVCKQFQTLLYRPPVRHVPYLSVFSQKTRQAFPPGEYLESSSESPSAGGRPAGDVPSPGKAVRRRPVGRSRERRTGERSDGSFGRRGLWRILTCICLLSYAKRGSCRPHFVIRIVADISHDRTTRNRTSGQIPVEKIGASTRRASRTWWTTSPTLPTFSPPPCYPRTRRPSTTTTPGYETLSAGRDRDGTRGLPNARALPPLEWVMHCISDHSEPLAPFVHCE